MLINKKTWFQFQSTLFFTFIINLISALGFQFAPPNIQLSTLVINTQATYTLIITRNYDSNLSPTPWDTQLVPAFSTFDVYFPAEYLSLTDGITSPSCSAIVINDSPVTGPFGISYSGSAGSLVLKISGAINTDIAMYSATLQIDGILNPSPALSTGTFVIKIGNDYSANLSGLANIALQPASFSSCQIKFNPTYVNTTGNMIITLGLKNSIPKNGWVNVRFPASLQWMRDISTNHQIPIEGVLTCQLQPLSANLTFISQMQCTGSSSTQIVQIIPLYSNSSSISQISQSSSLSFSINNLFSPPTTQQADSIQIISYSPTSYPIDKCTSTITNLSPKLMQVIYTSTGTPLYVNLATGFRVNFTLMDTVAKTDYFQFQFPSDSQISYFFKSSSLNLGTTTYISSNNTIIFQKSTSAGINFAGQKSFITFLTFKAPPSTRPSSNIRFVVKSSIGYEKMAGLGTIAAVQKTYNSTVSATNLAVSALSNYSISFTLADPLTSSGEIILIIPTQLNVITCPQLTPSGTITGTPSCTFSNRTSTNYTITLTSINSTSSGISANQIITINLINVTNYFAAINLTGISIKIYYTQQIIDLVAVSTTNTLTLTPRSAYVDSVLPGLNHTLDTSVPYTITAILQSGMPVGSGLLILQIDKYVSIISSTNISCVIEVISITNRSNIISQTTGSVTVTTAGNLLIPSVLSIKLLSNFTYSAPNLINIKLPASLLIRNPSTTAPILLKISSYDNQSNMIDNGVQYTSQVIFDPKPIDSILIIDRSSSINLAISNYTFRIIINGITNINDYINGSVIQTIIPPQMNVNQSSTKCYSNTTPAIDLACSISSNVCIIPTDKIVQIIGNTSQSFSFIFKITQLTNPVSLKPSSAFSTQVQTINSTSFYYYAVDNTSLTITNNATVQFSNLSYTWSNSAFGSLQTNLTIQINNTVAQLYSLILDVTNFSLFQGVLSTGTYNYSGCNSALITGITCFINIASNGTKTIQITNMIGGVASPIATNFNFILTSLLLTPNSIINPNPYIIPISGLDTSSYLIYSTRNMIKFEPMCIVPCATCPSSLQPSTCLSCYTDANISSLKYLYNSQCYAICPSNSYFNATLISSGYSYTCLTCSSNCKQCLGINSYCLSCYTNYYLYQHLSIVNSSISQCVSTCPPTTYSTNITINSTVLLECLGCISPCNNCISSNSTCLTCSSAFYQYTNISILNNTSNIVECLIQCPTNITVSDLLTMKCIYCVTPCLYCTNTTNNCTQCVANYYKISNQLLNDISVNSTNQTLYGDTCLSACPSKTLSIDLVTCQLCTSPCLTCNNSLTSCITCIINYYISSLVPYNTCVSTCEQYSFANSTSKICQLCSTVASLNCWDCISNTKCNRCDDPTKSTYVYFSLNQSCLQTVPDGYVNISGNATACTNNCTLCSVSTDNCTKCVGNFSLYINSINLLGSCLQICPSTYTNISNVCKKCLSPCLNCINTLTNCTTCLSTFYAFNGGCINSYECPLYYYINQTSKSCSPCVSPCKACINATFCLTCLIGALEQISGSCITDCPAGQVSSKTNKIINGTLIVNISVCMDCLTPCLTCVTLRQNCTTCIAGYFYYKEVFRCFLPCPTGITVPATIISTDNITNITIFTNVCLECTSPCRTCTSQITTCMTCISNYYLQLSSSTCVATCISGYYPADGQCKQCISPCSTCLALNNCLTCLNGFFYFPSGNNCVSSCPISAAIVINNICMPCQQGCLNCSSSSSLESSICFACTTPYALYNKKCYSTCPNDLILYLNATQNKYYCLTAAQYASIQLNITLAIDPSNVLPMPFTVAGLFLSIATFMSRLQSRGTYIIGVLYCWFGILETGVLAYFLFGVYSKIDEYGNKLSQYQDNAFQLGIIALAVIGGLNLLGLLIQSWYLWDDRQFRIWAKGHQDDTDQNIQNRPNKIKGTKMPGSIITPRDDQSSQCCSHKCTFITLTIISAVTSYKLKVLLFTGLFKFTGLSFPMESVHKFRVFNIFSFFGMLNQGLISYFIYLIAKQGISYDNNKLLFLQTIDLIIIIAINFILSILSVKKDPNFFQNLQVQKEQSQLEQVKKEEEERNAKYEQQRKQKQLKSKIYSLHRDFIGMDSYHSLKNKQYAQEQVEQIKQIQPNVDLQISQQRQSYTNLPIKSRQNWNKNKMKNQQSQNSNMGRQTKYNESDNDQTQENQINHNIMNSNRISKVSNAFWVQKQDKANIFQQDSFHNKTVKNNRKSMLSNPKQKVQSNMSMNNKNKVTFGLDKPPKSPNLAISYSTKQNTIKNTDKIEQKIKQNKKQVIIETKSPQEYKNILYKKQPQTKLNNIEQINLTMDKKSKKDIEIVNQKVTQKVKQKVTQKEYKSGFQDRDQDKLSNNKALIISKNPLSSQDISFLPILPFVHENGELRYREQSINKDKKQNINIFEPDITEDLDQQPILQEINLRAMPTIKIDKQKEKQKQKQKYKQKQKQIKNKNKIDETEINKKESKSGNKNVKPSIQKIVNNRLEYKVEKQINKPNEELQQIALNKYDKPMQQNKNNKNKQTVSKPYEELQQIVLNKPIQQKIQIKSSLMQINMQQNKKMKDKQPNEFIDQKQPIEKNLNTQINGDNRIKAGTFYNPNKQKVNIHKQMEKQQYNQIQQEQLKYEQKKPKQYIQKQQLLQQSQPIQMDKVQQINKSKNNNIGQIQIGSQNVINCSKKTDQNKQLAQKSIIKQPIKQVALSNHQENKSNINQIRQLVKQQPNEPQIQQLQLSAIESRQKNKKQIDNDQSINKIYVYKSKVKVKRTQSIQKLGPGQQFQQNEDILSKQIHQKQKQLSKIQQNLKSNAKKINKNKHRVKTKLPISDRQRLHSGLQNYTEQSRFRTNLQQLSTEKNQEHEQGSEHKLYYEHQHEHKNEPEQQYLQQQMDKAQVQQLKTEKKINNQEQIDERVIEEHNEKIDILIPSQNKASLKIEQNEEQMQKQIKKQQNIDSSMQKADRQQKQQANQTQANNIRQQNKQKLIQIQNKINENVQLTKSQTINKNQKNIAIQSVNQIKIKKRYSDIISDENNPILQPKLNNVVENLSQNYSQNITNNKLFQFDQSSLKRPKFQFQQSQEKLSNPFDGSIHSNTQQILHQLNQIDQDPLESQLSPGTRGEMLIRQDDTVPFENNYKNRPYNPITEANSQMQKSENDTISRQKLRAYQGDRQDMQLYDEMNEDQLKKRYRNKGDNNKQKVLSLIKEVSLKPIERSSKNFRKSKNAIPNQQKFQNLGVKLSTEDMKRARGKAEKQQSLAKKQVFKYPLKTYQLKLEGNQNEIEYDKDVENIPNQRSRIRNLKESKNQIQYASVQQISSRKKQNQQQLIRQNNIPNAETQVDLIKWKRQFAQEQNNAPQYRTEMQVPEKPIIDSEYQSGNEKSYQFQYQETDKSYHRGKLFMYDQSPNLFERDSENYREGSKDKSRSKGKTKRRYSREGKSRQKSHANSLQKIYLQKLDRKGF